MATLNDRTRANMDVALEEACRELPNGGDHAVRKQVAQRLLQSARKGNTTLGGLSAVARAALVEITKQRDLGMRPQSGRKPSGHSAVGAKSR